MNAKFTTKARNALNRAVECASEMGHTYIGSEHLLLGILYENDSLAASVLCDKGFTYEKVKKLVVNASGTGERTTLGGGDMTPAFRRIIEYSAQEVARSKGTFIGTEHFLQAVLADGSCFAHSILSADGMSILTIRGELNQFMRVGMKKSGSDSHKKGVDGCPLLSKYGKNLVTAAVNGELDPVIGRDAESERLMQIIARRTKNNVCLIGEPGVGKTAVVEGIALKIAEGTIPECLSKKVIVLLDVPSMIAGAKYRGEFEERMKGVMDEVAKNRNIILFIDEIHTLIGAGAAEGAIDAANIIKPALARGEMQIIGATTLDEYRRHIEKDAALERRLQPLIIEEPDYDGACKILFGIRSRYEQYHSLRITDGAVYSAIRLSSRYIHDRFLPDKAIDLIDEAASKKHILLTSAKGKNAVALANQKREALLREDFSKYEKLRVSETAGERINIDSLCGNEITILGEVNEEDIFDVISGWTKIPLNEIKKESDSDCEELEKKLSEAVIGQNNGVKTAVRAIRRGLCGIKDKSSPVAVLMFAGPSGTGKTLLARQISENIFGKGGKTVRFDMSEFSEKHSVSKLIGAPPGYVGYGDGGSLTDTVRRFPFSMIIFDEAEKAHPDVMNLLLQLCDEGRLSDSTGRCVDFSNTVVVFTTNAGASGILEKNKLGFSDASADSDSFSKRKENVMREMKAYFRTEFLNRLDDIILFDALDTDSLSAIAEKRLDEIKKTVSRKGITVDFDSDVPYAIAKKAYNRDFGARSVIRLVSTVIEDSLADFISENGYRINDTVLCKLDENGNAVFSVEDRTGCAV